MTETTQQIAETEYDIVIIGGGPAGMAAALRAAADPTCRVLLLERAASVGGILEQCVHDGFGLRIFGESLTGLEFARRYREALLRSPVEILTDTTVLDLRADRTVTAVSPARGMLKIHAGAVILAMGCRERTAGQLLLSGTRPAGILTAGQVQRLINVDRYLPGTTAVVLGSGDIGMIAARRMHLEGIRVTGVYEIASQPGGSLRNRTQCLDAFGIPLYLNRTVRTVHGRQRVSAVTIVRTDQNQKPVAGTEETIPCDLLVIAAGLIPENELSKGAGIRIDPDTGGPCTDPGLMTSVPGIFAAGNALRVFSLVDNAADSGTAAAESALQFLKGTYNPDDKLSGGF